jgi:hypothetical protein
MGQTTFACTEVASGKQTPAVAEAATFHTTLNKDSSKAPNFMHCLQC